MDPPSDYGRSGSDPNQIWPLEGIDEGLSSPRPVTQRAVQLLLRLLARLGNASIQAALGFVMLAGVATPAVVAVSHTWFTISLVALLFVIAMFLPTVSRKWANRATFGRPAFGVYGGVPINVLKATITTATDLWVDLPEKDARDLEAFARVNENFVAAHTKDVYLGIHGHQLGSEVAEDRWREFWDRVTTMPIARTTYQRALKETPAAFALVPGWLARSALVVPLAAVMLAIITSLSPYLLISLAPLRVMLATAVLFGLLAALAGAAVSGAHAGQTLSLWLPQEDFNKDVNALAQLSEQERVVLRHEAAAIVGRTIRIIDLKTGPRGKEAIAGFLGRMFFFVLAANMCYLLVFMGVCFAAALPFANDRGHLASGYGRQAAILLLLVICSLVAYRFWGFVIHRLGDVVGPAIGAAAAALIVPIGDYLTTGRVHFDLRTTASVIVAGLVGVVGTSIGAAFKNGGAQGTSSSK
jgi:hypothetical protein